LADWFETDQPWLGASFSNDRMSETGSSHVLKPSIAAALIGAVPASLSARLGELDIALQRGDIRTHRELRHRLDALGPWALPATNQVNIAPPVACLWGTVPLRVGLLRRTVGYLDFIFPPASAAITASAPGAARLRIVVTCPHAMDAGVSFSNLRALAWTDGLPVFGIRPALNSSVGKSGANDLWQSQTSEAEWLTLLTAGRRRIEQLCAEQGMDIAAVTVVGFSLGAINAVRLAEAWPEQADSGISIGISAIPSQLAERAATTPWLTLRAFGDGEEQGPSLENFFAERDAEAATPELELRTAPDFRFKENHAFAWRHLDTRLQSALARAFIRDLPRDRPCTLSDAGRIAALHQHLAAFTPRIEPVRSLTSGALLAAKITPAGAPRGLVISLPASVASRDELWPIELGWWGEKNWAAMIAPDASPDTLRKLLAYVRSHPDLRGLPCYVVLYEGNPHRDGLWAQALDFSREGQVRALGWVADTGTGTLYKDAGAAHLWPGPGADATAAPAFRIFVSDGVRLASGLLARQAGAPWVVLAASDSVLAPAIEAAWLGLARIFKADAQGAVSSVAEIAIPAPSL